MPDDPTAAIALARLMGALLSVNAATILSPRF